MRLTWTSHVPDEAQRAQWNALVLRMEKPEVFYTWEWATAVSRAYRSSLEPWVATAYEGDELVGVAALAKPSATEATFLTATTADYCDFISLPEKREEFVALVLQALRLLGVQTLVLANLPEESPTVAALRGDASFRSFLRTGYVCGQVSLGPVEERSGLAESLLKKKVLRRALRTLQGMGPLTLRHDSDSELPPGALDEFCVTHVARFLATGRISAAVRPERRTFLQELAGLLRPQGWLDLTSLRVGDQAVAWNYGFRFHGSWFWYQPTFVNPLEDLSPGLCLLAKLIENACQDREAHCVDLGLGAEGYKERFANSQRTTLHATLSCSSVALWKVRTRYRAAETAGKYPKVEALARQAQRWAQATRKNAEGHGWAHSVAGMGQRLRRLVGRADEVSFFRWTGDAAEYGPGQELVTVDWKTLAKAAMRYQDDGETLDYLLQSAARLRAGKDRGYVLVEAEGDAQHFAWVASYQGFPLAALAEVLQAPTASSVIIFGCWTPRELRNRGLFTNALRQLGKLLSVEGKDVWTFSAASGRPSVAGIEKAGFQLQFSLSKRKVLWWTESLRESRSTPPSKPVGALSNQAVR